MKFLEKKVTIFLVLGILSILAGVVWAIALASGASAPDKLAAVYIGFALVPVSLVILVDRICVWKFGSTKVNKVQLYLVGIFMALFIIKLLTITFTI